MLLLKYVLKCITSDRAAEEMRRSMTCRMDRKAGARGKEEHGEERSETGGKKGDGEERRGLPSSPYLILPSKPIVVSCINL